MINDLISDPFIVKARLIWSDIPNILKILGEIWVEKLRYS